MLSIEAMLDAHSATRDGRRADALLEQAARLACHAPSPLLEGQLVLARGVVGYLRGDYRGARDLLLQAEATFRERCTGASYHLATALTHTMWTRMFLGELAVLARSVPALLAEAERRGDRIFAGMIQAYPVPLLRLAADDPAGARRVLDELEAGATCRQPRCASPCSARWTSACTPGMGR
jgi:hypothetical protein